jgi:hypothetical protein
MMVSDLANDLQTGRINGFRGAADIRTHSDFVTLTDCPVSEKMSHSKHAIKRVSVNAEMLRTLPLAGF